MLASPVPLRAFYDLDTPVTLARLARGEPVPYIGPRGPRATSTWCSATPAAPRSTACASGSVRARVAPLYGSVDPERAPAGRRRPQHYRADLSYLGTFAADRQAALEELFVEPARRLPERRFVIGGARLPGELPLDAPTSTSSATCRRPSTRPSSARAG